MHLSHQTPPVKATGIRSDAETGVRTGFKFIQFFDVSEDDAQAVDDYIKSLEPVPSPYLVNGKLLKSAKQGKLVYKKPNAAPLTKESFSRLAATRYGRQRQI